MCSPFVFWGFYSASTSSAESPVAAVFLHFFSYVEKQLAVAKQRWTLFENLLAFSIIQIYKVYNKFYGIFFRLCQKNSPKASELSIPVANWLFVAFPRKTANFFVVFGTFFWLF